MSKAKELLLVVIAGMLFAGGVAAAEDEAVDAEELDFVLVNKTGLVIDELYISPASAEDWQEDVLGIDTLADGEKVKISFSGGESEKKWDIRIVDEDKDEVVWEGFDLSEIKKLTLFYRKGGKPTAKIE